MQGFSFYASPGGFKSVRGDMLTAVTGLPAWARLIVVIFALPGICLIGLSALMLAASIATLLLLSVPAYLVLRWLTGLFSGLSSRSRGAGGEAPEAYRNSRRIEATVVEVGPSVSRTRSDPSLSPEL